jgi:myosin heavy subunit
MAELDKLRTDLMSASAVKLQAAARGFIARRRYQRIRKAVLTLQVRPSLSLPVPMTFNGLAWLFPCAGL